MGFDPDPFIVHVLIGFPGRRSWRYWNPGDGRRGHGNLYCSTGGAKSTNPRHGQIRVFREISRLSWSKCRPRRTFEAMVMAHAQD